MLSHKDFVIALLLEEGLLTKESLERATRYATENKLPIQDAAVATGALTERDLALARAAVSECPFVDLDRYDINLMNAALLPRSVAERLCAFPLFDLGRVITVGMADPLDLRAVDRLRTQLKVEIHPVLCEPRALHAIIDRAYALTGGAQPADDSSLRTPNSELGAHADEPLVAAINQIIIQAVEQGASDIHLEPDERELHLRYRIDGALQLRQGPPLSSHPGLVQRLKVMANLDLTQTRRPQDGKFRFQHGGRAVDLRLSVMPTVCGENAVLRILTGAGGLGDLSQLGLSPDMVAACEQVIANPHGMALVTGPTGSGKTTTLYSFLKRLNTAERNLVTIEDPVEMRMPMVRQVQVNHEIGMTFAGALRSILRQDPDVILVGEIRDEETARIAIQSALTGHLVLTTLHTNDAPGAVARLRDFGCPAFAINAAVLCVLAQRLVRRTCPDCSAPYTPDAALVRRFCPGDNGQFRRGAGCAKCLNTGFRGRIGAYEMLRLNGSLQLAVERGASSATLRQEALRFGMAPLWRDGLDKAKLGLTTLEEVARVAAGSFEEDATNPAPGEPMRLSA